MSRPRVQQRTSFGNPFRMILPGGSYLSRRLVVLLSSFEQTLAEGLEKLRPEEISDIWTLSWLSHAMNFLSETHENIKNLITDLELPVSDWEEKWIDVYLDGSIKLLDVCIAVISELSRLHQGQVLLQYALHALESSSNYPSSEKLRRCQATLSDWKQQIDTSSPKLEDAYVILHALTGTLYSSRVKKSAKGKVLMRALCGVKVVTTFVCSVFISALSGCSKPLVTVVVPGKFLWAAAFNNLQADILKEVTSEISGKKAVVLKELEAVEKCVEGLCALSKSSRMKGDDIPQENGVTHCEGTMSEAIDDHEGTERWKEALFELAQTAGRLDLGLDHLVKKVEDFFQIVLMGRDALLSNLTISDEVIDSEGSRQRGHAH